MKVEVARVSSFNLRNLLGHDVQESVIRAHTDCLQRSNVIWLGRADGIEACAAGLIPATIFAEEPYLWMIHTKICLQHPLPFIRWSKKIVGEMLELYPSVVGLCRCENESGQRWLEWLGAKFDTFSLDGNHVGFRIKKW